MQLKINPVMCVFCCITYSLYWTDEVSIKI